MELEEKDVYNKENLPSNIVLIFEDESYEEIPKDKIKNLHLVLDDEYVKEFSLTLSFEYLNQEFEFFANCKNIEKISILDTDFEDEIYYFTYFKKDELVPYEQNNLLEDTDVNIKNKEVTLNYRYEETKPEFDILNHGTEKKPIYRKEDISEYLIYEYKEDFPLEMLDGVQFGNSIISVTDTGEYYILSLTDVNSRLTTSALFEKDGYTKIARGIYGK